MSLISRTAKSWLYAFSLFALVGIEARAQQILANSIKVKIGTYDGNLSSLSAAGDSNRLNLYTNSYGNLSAIFKFPTGSLSSSLSLAANFGQNRAADVFTFQALNANGAWLKLGSATGSTSLQSLSFSIPSQAVVNGAVTVRLISSKGADDCALDFLAINGSATSSGSGTSTSSGTSISGGTTTSTNTNTGSTASLTIGSKWYWQLEGTVNTNVAAKVYDIDMFNTSASEIASLKASGHTVICYFSAGSYEVYRPDASSFPASVIGNKLVGWAGEYWLDVRSPTVLSIMATRLDLAKAKGCDGVEPDNVDGYANNSGFPLTMQDQITFNKNLADQAHARGMIIALKNSTDLVNSLVNSFDLAVVEECFQYNECSAYSPFISQGKAVLNAEYSSYSSSICTQAAQLKFSTVFFNLALDGTVFNPCP